MNYMVLHPRRQNSLSANPLLSRAGSFIAVFAKSAVRSYSGPVESDPHPKVILLISFCRLRHVSSVKFCGHNCYELSLPPCVLHVPAISSVSSSLLLHSSCPSTLLSTLVLTSLFVCSTLRSMSLAVRYYRTVLHHLQNYVDIFNLFVFSKRSFRASVPYAVNVI
jgi:hypothetical protein